MGMSPRIGRAQSPRSAKKYSRSRVEHILALYNRLIENRRGKTSVLDPTEARQLLDAIDIATPVGLRDRALIGLMVFSFARIGGSLGSGPINGF
jgi:integrase